MATSIAVKIEDRFLPRLAPEPLELSETERSELQQLVNRHSTPQQIALRARIILLADHGHNHRQIATELNILSFTTHQNILPGSIKLKFGLAC